MFEARKLAVTRGGRRLFEGVDFSLEPGELLLLEGANGSGKSSLLRLCAGLLPMEQGTLAWKEERLERHHVAYLGHLLGLKRHLSVEESLAFSCALSLSANGFDAYADLFDLASLMDLPVQMLSAGQRQRVALASTMSTGRDIWLLDEPESGLDLTSRQKLVEALEHHKKRDGVTILATHHSDQFRPTQILGFGV